MADRKIGYAVQSGNIVRVYDERKCQIMTRNGKLKGSANRNAFGKII